MSSFLSTRPSLFVSSLSNRSRSSTTAQNTQGKCGQPVRGRATTSQAEGGHSGGMHRTELRQTSAHARQPFAECRQITERKEARTGGGGQLLLRGLVGARRVEGRLQVQLDGAELGRGAAERQRQRNDNRNESAHQLIDWKGVGVRRQHSERSRGLSMEARAGWNDGKEQRAYRASDEANFL
jgi:hypothetical protein